MCLSKRTTEKKRIRCVSPFLQHQSQLDHLERHQPGRRQHASVVIIIIIIIIIIFQVNAHYNVALLREVWLA